MVTAQVGDSYQRIINFYLNLKIIREVTTSSIRRPAVVSRVTTLQTM